jgi:hypothetical protein
MLVEYGTSILTDIQNLDSRVAELAGQLERIILIQAWWKGARYRRLHPAPQLQHITVIKSMSEHCRSPSETVRNVEAKLGPFLLSWNMQALKATCEWRKPFSGSDHTLYCGYWLKGRDVKEGYGQLLFPDGGKYEGMWHNNDIEGEGRLIYAAGNYYVGQWIRGKANGQGTHVSRDGTVYVGGWRDNRYHGYGKALSHNDRQRDVARWLDLRRRISSRRQTWRRQICLARRQLLHRSSHPQRIFWPRHNLRVYCSVRHLRLGQQAQVLRRMEEEQGEWERANVLPGRPSV